MSTKRKWMIALFSIQLLAFIGLGVSRGMAVIGTIATVVGMCAFGIAGFILWHYDSIDRINKQQSEKQGIGFREESDKPKKTNLEVGPKEPNAYEVYIVVAIIVFIFFGILIGVTSC